jgi:small-conductance mechanosensitive channel
VFISNSHIYQNPLVVRTGFDSHIVRLNVGIGYSDDLERGREVIEQATRESEGVFIEPAPKAFVTGFGDSSVDLTVFFLTGPKQTNIVAVTDRVAANIKKALDEAGIEMPYPHSVVEVRQSEEPSSVGQSQNEKGKR